MPTSGLFQGEMNQHDGIFDVVELPLSRGAGGRGDG